MNFYKPKAHKIFMSCLCFFWMLSCSKGGSSSLSSVSTSAQIVNLSGNLSNIGSFESLAAVSAFRIYALSTDGLHSYADVQNDGSFELSLSPNSLYLLYLLKDSNGDDTYETLLATFDADTTSPTTINLIPVYNVNVDLGTLNIPGGGAGSLLGLTNNPANGNDMDNDGISDEIDSDIDGNEIDDLEDLAIIDIDGDKIPNPIDNDMDGDGLLNVYDSNPIDPSASPEPYDQDSDGDGISDSLDAEPTSLNGDLNIYYASGNIAYINPSEALTAVAVTTSGRFIRVSVTSTGDFEIPLRENEAFLLYFMNGNVISNAQDVNDFRGIIDPIYGTGPNLLFIGKTNLNLGSLTLPLNPATNTIFVRRSIFAARDSDEDGIDDSSDTDANGNGILDTTEVLTLNFDGDNLPNILDSDDDNDTITDNADSDRDGDGLADAIDIDGDGIADISDIDIDNDGQVDGSNPGVLPAPDLEAPIVDTSISFPAPQIQFDSLRVSWGAARDNATSAVDLEYKVVRADDSESIDSIDEANAITGTALVQDWIPNITNVDALGLSYPHTYFFAVLVRDDAGNMSLYSPQSQATEDHTNPVAGSAIDLTNPSPGNHNIVVNWGAATDNASLAVNLSYKIVESTLTDASDIDTLEEALLATNIPMNWTKNVTSYDVTSLDEFKTYSFAVIVKDENGNMDFYEPSTISTIDTSNPVVSSTIHFSGLTPNSVNISWSGATDSDSTLSYKVVQSTTPLGTDIDTVLEALSATEVMPWAQGTLTTTASSLDQNTLYYFAVLVKDTTGNTNIYAPQGITTLDSTAPSVGATPSYDPPTASDITLHWDTASDDFTAPEFLEYKVVSALSPDEIDTIEEAELAPDLSRTVILPWTADIYTATAMGLSSGVSYSFTVLVKDGDGKISIYSPVSVTTVDNLAPTPGSGPTVSDIQINQMTLSWTVASDNLSDAANLEYKVLRSADSTLIDEVGEEDADISDPGNVVSVMDWTVNTLTIDATSLSGNTEYNFSVFVRDELGQVNVYSPTANATTLDGTVPVIDVPADDINSTGTTTSSTVLQWGAAADNVTAPENLSYKIVKIAASTGSAIDTVDEADAITTLLGGLVLDWTIASTIATAPTYQAPTYTVTGLSDTTQYYFAVLVKDEAGNRNIYPVKTVTTSAPPDVTAPTTGSIINFSNTYDTRTLVNWGVASDAVTAQSSLQYKVVRASSTTAIDTLEEADGVGPTLVKNWSTFTSPPSQAVTGLTASTSYAFAVLVKDAAGNKALYSPVSVTTTAAMKYLFVSNASYKGNFGMSNADVNCNNEGKSRFDNTKTYKALLVGGTTRRACTNSNCNSNLEGEHSNWVLSANTMYKDKVGNPIGTTTANKIFSFPLTQGIDPTLASNVFVWTGLNADWTTSSSTCVSSGTSWASNRNGVNGQSGSPIVNTSSSIKSSTPKSCKNTSARLYCVEQ